MSAAVFRRAPCIGTPRQPIDFAAALGAFLTGPAPRDDGRNRWLFFRRVFTLPAPADEARVTVTVDGRYQLFVNGVRVGRGPARCDPLHQRTDTHDVRAMLGPGTNVLAVLVHVYGADTSWYQRARDLWQQVFGDGALYVDGRVRCGMTAIDVGGDPDWRCLESDAWQCDVPRINWGLGFIEVHDARHVPLGWTRAEFDDRDWDRVQILTAGGGPPDGLLGGVAIEPFPTLVPREIPFLVESPVAPLRLLATYAVTPRPELPADARPFEEPLAPLPDGRIDRPEALLDAGPTPTIVRTTDTHDTALLLDFGRIWSAYPFIEIDAQGGEVVEVTVGEGLPGDPPLPGAPRLSREAAHGAHVCRYTARPGAQRFERFEWSAVRYMQVTVRNAPDGLAIRHAGATFTRYPAEDRGAFTCSDAMLTRLWDAGRETLRLCMHDAWEDCPGREQRQWLGDATVELLVGQAAFGPSVNALNRQFLLHAAESQRPDGLTQMYAPGDHHVDSWVIPDWTLQWILNAEQHALYTGDLETAAQVFPAIQRALAWFERQLGPGDLVANLPYWHFHDWAALGRRGEAATLNAVLVGALRSAAWLAAALEMPRIARRYEALAARVAAALDRRHWDGARGVYVDCVDPASGEQDRRVSQHANAAAILWDVAPRERWALMIARITDPARLAFTAAPPIVPSGDAFDPEQSVVLANTFFSHFVYRALARAGRVDLVLAALRDRYARMLARGATTLWESFDPTASLCHGFSATPVYQLSTEVLGVYPLEAGFQRFRFAPTPCDVTWARGVFPTVQGDVRVAWERSRSGLDVELTVPPGTTAVLPSGATLAPGTHRVRGLAG